MKTPVQKVQASRRRVAAGLTAGAVGALGGLVVALAAAAVGAYSGSVAGALGRRGRHRTGEWRLGGF